jgi:hypothetical protein
MWLNLTPEYRFHFIEVFIGTEAPIKVKATVILIVRLI